MKRKTKGIFLAFFILLLFFLFIKVNTNIYVGDYSYDFYEMDICVKIDDRVILDDTIKSSPYFPTVVKEKLRYGIHDVSVYSNKADVSEKKESFFCQISISLSNF